MFLLHVIRKQVFLQIYCRGIGTFLFIVLIRYCWKLLKICILELMMHKCGTEKQTEGTKTENLMDTVWIYKARKIKAFKILVQFRLWCWLTHGGVSMSPRCEKSAEAYGTFCRVLNKKNRKCTKKSLNVVQIHASPYENFSKCLLNLMRTYEHLSKLPRCDSNLARSTCKLHKYSWQSCTCIRTTRLKLSIC